MERRKGGGGNGGGGEPRYVRPGYGLRELLGTCSVTQDNVAALVQKCEQCVAQLSEAMRFGVSSGSTFQLQKIADALRVAFDEERPSNEYRLCVQELPERDRQRNGGGKEVRTLDTPRTLGYWCFHSGGAMKQLIEMVEKLAEIDMNPIVETLQKAGWPGIRRKMVLRLMELI